MIGHTSRQSDGTTALPVLGMLVVAALAVTELSRLAAYSSTVESLRWDHEQAYWLAKGRAVSALRALRDSEGVSTGTQTYANGEVTTRITLVQNTDTVVVTARTPYAVATIEFEYGHGQLLNWEEDVQSPQW